MEALGARRPDGAVAAGCCGCLRRGRPCWEGVVAQESTLKVWGSRHSPGQLSPRSWRSLLTEPGSLGTTRRAEAGRLFVAVSPRERDNQPSPGAQLDRRTGEENEPIGRPPPWSFELLLATPAAPQRPEPPLCRLRVGDSRGGGLLTCWT